MSTDRELLELAAKAANLDTHWGSGWQADTMFLALPRPNSPLTASVEWNPLTDDGDALRLAVKLKMNITIYSNGAEADCDTLESTCKEGGNDPYAATRRAIVRAAAEIGQGIAQQVNPDLPEDNYYKTQAEAEKIGRAAAEIGRYMP